MSTGWARETRVRDLLNHMIREHDQQTTTGISGAALATYTTSIMEIFHEH